MKKPKPTWPGFMDEIEAVKKAPAFTDASFTAFFFQGSGRPNPHCAALLAFLRMGMKQRKDSLTPQAGMIHRLPKGKPPEISPVSSI